MKPVRHLTLGLVIFASVMVSLPAHAQLWRCERSDGQVLYTNDPRSVRQAQQKCQALSVPTVSAPTPRTTPAASSSRPTPSETLRHTPQDDLRLRILIAELSSERERLIAAQRELEATQDPNERPRIARRVAQHERNLAAIAREMKRLQR